MTPLLGSLILIQGIPFNNSQFERARSVGIYEAVHRACAGCQCGRCCTKGTVPGNESIGVREPLYRARMRVEADNRDKAAVIKVYEELCDRPGQLFGDSETSDGTASLGKTLLSLQ